MHARPGAAETAYGLLAGALVFLVTFAVLAVLVRGNGLSSLDHLVRNVVLHSTPLLFRPAMEAASFWGGTAGQVGIIAVATAMFWCRRRSWALSLPLIMAGTGILQLTLKWVMNRPRPNLDPWGFPSAHVLSLVVLFGCIAYVISTSGLHRTRRWLGVGGCGLIVCVVGYSRMYLDAHWFSDVLGGLSVGLSYLLTVIWVRTSRRGVCATDAFRSEGSETTLEVVSLVDISTAISSGV